MSRTRSQSTKAESARLAAERAAALRAEQERRERRRLMLVLTAIVATLVGIAVAGWFVLRAVDPTGGVGEVPRGAVDTYAVAVGSDDAAVVVTVYEDLLCPYCGRFEQVSSERLAEYAESGDVQVRYHVVSFLDDASTTDYSTRAANALAVVLDTAGPEAAVRFHDALFDHQPEEGSAGLPDETLVDLAVEAGADEARVAGPIADLRFEQWVVNATDAWSRRGFRSTPTVTVDGEAVDFTTAEDLLSNTQAAIAEALAR